MFNGSVALPLSLDTLKAIIGEMERAAIQAYAREAILSLKRNLVLAIAGVSPAVPHFDPLVEAALELIQKRALDETSLEAVAKAVHLSPDRLRHLFKTQVGCTLSNYARTRAIWKTLSPLTDCGALTEIAHTLGFYDQSNFML